MPKPSGKKDSEGNPYLYYTCVNVNRDGSASTCKLRNIPGRAFERLIAELIGEIGRCPEIIRSAVAGSNKTKRKLIRPLKSQLNKLNKRHREVEKQIQNYLETVKLKGAKYLGRESTDAAEKLAEEKHQLEIEREKVKIDIAHKEQVIIDENQVAESLLSIEEVFEALPYEKKKELLGLLIRDISVNHFDPEKDRLPDGETVFFTKMRTFWYVVNISFFANDLLSDICKNGELSSHFDPIGCSGRGKTRTSYDLSLVIGITPLRGKHDVIIAYPFRYPESYRPEKDKETVVQEAAKHPIHLASIWAHEMKTDPELSMSQVAEGEGLSRARVTQNMSLLKFNKDIRDYLSNLTCRKKIRFFSERRLRPLTRLHQSEQSRIFGEMVEVCDKKLGGCGAE